MDTLSHDLICHILSYLSYTEVTRFLATCVTYACYLQDNTFWRRYIINKHSYDFLTDSQDSVSPFINLMDTKLSKERYTWYEVAKSCRYKAGFTVPQEDGSYNQQIFSMPLAYANGPIVRTIFNRSLVIGSKTISLDISIQRVFEYEGVNKSKNIKVLCIDNDGNLLFHEITKGRLPFPIDEDTVCASTCAQSITRHLVVSNKRNKIFHAEIGPQFQPYRIPESNKPCWLPWNYLIQAKAKILTLVIIEVNRCVFLYFLTEHQWLYCGMIYGRSFVPLYKEPGILALNKHNQVAVTLSEDGKIYVRKNASKRFITAKQYCCIEGVYHIVSKRKRFFRLDQYLSYRIHEPAYFIRMLN